MTMGDLTPEYWDECPVTFEMKQKVRLKTEGIAEGPPGGIWVEHSLFAELMAVIPSEERELIGQGFPHMTFMGYVLYPY